MLIFEKIFRKTLSFKIRSSSGLRNFKEPLWINLCCGLQKIPGYIGVDFLPGAAEIVLDLRNKNLPFLDNSIEKLVCISAINYFKYQRAKEIINDVFRVLKPGALVRFGVQDLELIAKRYVNKELDFFFEKLPNGKDRYFGATLGDKFNSWFYGYEINGNPCQYFYDYDSLALLFKESGFSIIERKNYLESRLVEVELIDNRPEQMFFLEAKK